MMTTLSKYMQHMNDVSSEYCRRRWATKRRHFLSSVQIKCLMIAAASATMYYIGLSCMQDSFIHCFTRDLFLDRTPGGKKGSFSS